MVLALYTYGLTANVAVGVTARAAAGVSVRVAAKADAKAVTGYSYSSLIPITMAR